VARLKLLFLLIHGSFPFQEELKKPDYGINVPVANICAEKWIESLKFENFDPITALDNLRSKCKSYF